MAGKNALPQTLRGIPTRRQSQILYYAYIVDIQTITPVIHPPLVLKEYDTFGNWYEMRSTSGEPCPNPAFTPLLYAIWYGGSVTTFMQTLEEEFQVSSRLALSMTFVSPEPVHLKSYSLFNCTDNHVERGRTNDVSVTISFAIRVAQTLGLHRDPANFGIQGPKAEYRRRLWWHIIHIDSVYALSTGIPPLLDDDVSWDVRETSELKDFLLGTSEEAEYERAIKLGGHCPDLPDYLASCEAFSKVHICYLTSNGKYAMARGSLNAIRRILKIQLSTKPIERKELADLREILTNLGTTLNNIAERIPDCIPLPSSNPSTSLCTACLFQDPTDDHICRNEPWNLSHDNRGATKFGKILGPFYQWSKIILSLYLVAKTQKRRHLESHLTDQIAAFCVAYQPFLKHSDSPIRPEFIQLATNPKLRSFSLELARKPSAIACNYVWSSTLFAVDVLKFARILLVDLYERPHSLEALTSRLLIDNVMALLGPDGGVVGVDRDSMARRLLQEEGREAWSMIRNLRRISWLKIGLNPDILWVQNDQTNARFVLSTMTTCRSSSRPSSDTCHSSGPSQQQLDGPSHTQSMNNQNPNFNGDLGIFAQQSLPQDRFYDPSNRHRSQQTNSAIFTSQSLPGHQAIPTISSDGSTVENLNTPFAPLPSMLQNQNPRTGPWIPVGDANPGDAVRVEHSPFPDCHLNFDWTLWDAVFGIHPVLAEDFMGAHPLNNA
ncbi:uncharacterized protein N7477_003376 [Penicillium maclennaniae]|uniref:uncharacterized protein n=1 Tax=Penicillium maclennaniae TaxID=1343394 RepID=UPI002540958A|nr:uncharacterized protein N7477_003376 [Penicillium maclennaniae]KAJ5677743.1 hypothetical protein N7477_003376 [Penicillium maclennaniae]